MMDPLPPSLMSFDVSLIISAIKVPITNKFLCLMLHICALLPFVAPLTLSLSLHMTNLNPYHSTISPPPPQAAASFHERSRRIKMAAEMGLARSSSGRHWSQALRRRLLRQKRRSTGAGACGRNAKNEEPDPMHRSEVAAADELSATEGEGEEAEVEKRVRALQTLVPGGEELGADMLFEEAADYIVALQGQVNAMRALVGLIGGMEEESMMRG